MLFNPQWQLPEADSAERVFENARLMAWLREQDPKRQYSYGSCSGCLLAQYLTGSGLTRVHVDALLASWESGMRPLPEHWDQVAHGGSMFDLPNAALDWTFGAALARAERLLQE